VHPQVYNNRHAQTHTHFRI